MEFPKKKKKDHFFWVIRIEKKFDTLKFGVLSLTYQILVKFGCKTKKWSFFFFFLIYASNRSFFLRIGIKWSKIEIFRYFKSFFARVDRK